MGMASVDKNYYRPYLLTETVNQKTLVFNCLHAHITIIPQNLASSPNNFIILYYLFKLLTFFYLVCNKEEPHTNIKDLPS